MITNVKIAAQCDRPRCICPGVNITRRNLSWAWDYGLPAPRCEGSNSVHAFDVSDNSEFWGLTFTLTPFHHNTELHNFSVWSVGMLNILKPWRIDVNVSLLCLACVGWVCSLRRSATSPLSISIARSAVLFSRVTDIASHSFCSEKNMSNMSHLDSNCCLYRESTNDGARTHPVLLNCLLIIRHGVYEILVTIP